MAKPVRRGQIIYCRLCGMGWSIVEEIPNQCPNETCKETPGKWTTVSPKYRWKDPGRQFNAQRFTGEDWIVLKVNRIDPEQD